MATLDELEKSSELSEPVELYSFALGATTYQRTSSEGVVTYLGTNYTPLEIKRSNPQQSKEQKATALTITLPSASDVVTDFIAVQPSRQMTVQVLRIQPSAAIAASIIIFDGFVASIAFKDHIAEARCIPFNELVNREVPRFQFQGLCNHELYDARCKVVAAKRFHSAKAGQNC